MKCPKCCEEMQIGEIGYVNGNGGVFWASKEFFNKKICNCYTKNGAIKEGAMDIPLGNGFTHNRTKAYACKKCKFVLIDCNQ